MARTKAGGLQLQQLPLAMEAISIAAEGSVGGDDTVAGDEEGDGIAGQGLADCSGGRAMKEPGEVAVGAGLAVRDGEKRLPDAALEGGTLRMEARKSMRLPAGKIIVQPSEGLGNDGDRCGRHIGGGESIGVIYEAEAGEAFAIARKKDGA